MPASPDIRGMLRPQSVALFGATPRPGAAASYVWRNLDAVNYPGRIYPVNPRYAEVYGLPCFPGLADLPEVPDLVFVGTAAALAVEAIEQAVACGIRSAVLNASGFAEAGPDGLALQTAMVGVAASGGLALCGPNNMGFINYAHGIPLWTGLAPLQSAPGRVALISQSGSACIALTEHVHRPAFSHVITAGTEAVVNVAQYLDALAQDDRVSTILLFLETIRDPVAFAAAARRAHETGKRVAVLKVGRSESGRAAVAAHSGGLSGEQAVYDAYFRNLGILAVSDLDELVEAAILLTAYAEPPPGRSIVATTISGGEAALVADLAEARGVPLATLPAAAIEAMRDHLPAFWSIRNPLDVYGLGWNPGAFEAIATALASIGETGAIVCCVDAPENGGVDVPLVGEMAGIAAALARQFKKPFIFVNTTTGQVNPSVRELLDGAGIPYLSGLDPALSVIGRWLAWTPPRPLSSGNPGGRGARLLASREHERFAILRAASVPMIDSIDVADAEAAVEAAGRLGYPAVMKGTAPRLAHKTELGLVRLGLGDEGAVRRAYADLDEIIGASVHPRGEAAVVVQPMLQGGIELLLAASNVPGFGTVVIVGLGGTLVELMGAVSLRIGPVDGAMAHEMLAETAAARLLRGYRGQGPFDIDAVVAAIVALSHLMADEPSLAVIEINPFIALPAGRGACGVDLVVESAGPEGTS